MIKATSQTNLAFRSKESYNEAITPAFGQHGRKKQQTRPTIVTIENLEIVSRRFILHPNAIRLIVGTAIISPAARSFRGKIGRISPAGQVTEFPLPNPASGPEGITVGSDGNLWFTEFNNNKIGRITS